MTTETGYVYTLSDPRTDELRYVGATKRPQQRLKSHINNPHNDSLAEWVDELQSDGLEPEMRIIDAAETNELSAKERAAIDRLSDRFELFNHPSASGYNDDIAISSRDRRVLRVLATGRANPYLIREETGLGKGTVNTRLNQLGRNGHVEQVTTGLYEITEKGRAEVSDDE